MSQHFFGPLNGAISEDTYERMERIAKRRGATLPANFPGGGQRPPRSWLS